MECTECNGLGYKEYEHGLIRLTCARCGGTGEARNVSLNHITKTKGELYVNGDSGAGADNQDTGSGPASQPEQSPKPKARKSTGKKAK